MAQQAETVITIGGDSAEDLGVRFGEVFLDQSLEDHHRFLITCRALDEESVGVYGSRTLDALARRAGDEVRIEVHTPNREESRHRLVFSGILLGATMRRVASGGYELDLKGAAPTILMDHFPRKRHWEDSSLSQIVGDILDQYGFDSDVKGPDADVPVSFQYEESDYNFLMRMSERRGCWFFWDGEAAHWTLDLEEPVCPAIELTMGASSSENLISRFELSYWTNPDLFGFRAYNHERGESYVHSTDQVSLRGQFHPWLDSARGASERLFTVQGHGTVTEPMRSPSDLRSFVGSFKLSRLPTAVSGTGETENPDIRPPAIVQIQNVGADQEGEYLVTAVHHVMDAAQGHYRNSIEFVPVSSAYPRWNRRRPSVTALLTGIVVGAYDQTRPGMIRVRLNDWIDGTTGMGSSTDGEVVTVHLRVAQQYAGKGHGIFFVPEIDDEVLIGFEHGDPERPVVIGSLYNENTSAAFDRVADDMEANEGRVILTKGGQVLRFSDRDGDETIEISTPEAESRIRMVAGKSIDMATTGDITISAGGNITIKAEKKITAEAGEGMECLGHPEVRIESETLISEQSSEIEISCDGSIITEAMGKIAVKSAQEVDVNSQGKLALTAAQTASMTSQGADATVKGTMKAKLESGASVVESDPTGVNVNGPLVRIN